MTFLERTFQIQARGQLHRERRGVSAGGRTGLTAVVVGLLFLATLFVARFVYMAAGA
jgi:hypothetical protein